MWDNVDCEYERFAGKQGSRRVSTEIYGSAWYNFIHISEC